MPASLYRLVGKPHHAEAPEAQLSQNEKATETVGNVIEQPVPVVAPEPVVEAAPAETVEETVATVEPPAVQLSETETPVAKVTWDSSWTKSQLLQAANEMGLSLPSTSTKADIIAALESAK